MLLKTALCNAELGKLRADLAKRKKERKLLEAMLVMDGFGGLSMERVAALKSVFCKDNIPRTDSDIQLDRYEREAGLAEMNAARIAWEDKKKLSEHPDERFVHETGNAEQRVPNPTATASTTPLKLTEAAFVDILKCQRERDPAEDLAYRNVMRNYYKNKPFPEKSSEWEHMS